MTKTKSRTCKICKQKFKRPWNVTLHKATAHKIYLMKAVCKVCDGLFSNIPNMRVHYKRFHQKKKLKVTEVKWVRVHQSELMNGRYYGLHCSPNESDSSVSADEFDQPREIDSSEDELPLAELRRRQQTSMVVSNENLVVSDEDLVVSDEDLVVSDEDLVVSDQDLVVVNEDLVVVNEDLVVSNEDLAVSNEDLGQPEEIKCIVVNGEPMETSDEAPNQLNQPPLQGCQPHFLDPLYAMDVRDSQSNVSMEFIQPLQPLQHIPENVLDKPREVLVQTCTLPTRMNIWCRQVMPRSLPIGNRKMVDYSHPYKKQVDEKRDDGARVRFSGRVQQHHGSSNIRIQVVNEKTIDAYLERFRS